MSDNQIHISELEQISTSMRKRIKNVEPLIKKIANDLIKFTEGGGASAYESIVLSNTITRISEDIVIFDSLLYSLEVDRNEQQTNKSE